MAETFNCPTCGGPLEYARSAEITIRCPYCHNTVIVPEEIRGSLRVGGPASVEDRSETKETAAPPVDPLQVETDIRALLAARQKITAIKVYRQVTRAGLKEAKDAVEAIEAGGSLDASQLLPQKNPISLLGDDASTFSQAAQLLREGNKIAAIRLLRDRYDVSLLVAKEAADLLEKGQKVDIEWLKIRAKRTASASVKLPLESRSWGVSDFIPWGCIALVLLVVIFIIVTVVLR